VGLRRWAIGGSGWEFGWDVQNDKDLSPPFTVPLNSASNWIDTAAIYGLDTPRK